MLDHEQLAGRPFLAVNTSTFKSETIYTKISRVYTTVNCTTSFTPPFSEHHSLEAIYVVLYIGVSISDDNI